MLELDKPKDVLDRLLLGIVYEAASEDDSEGSTDSLFNQFEAGLLQDPADLLEIHPGLGTGRRMKIDLGLHARTL